MGYFGIGWRRNVVKLEHDRLRGDGNTTPLMARPGFGCLLGGGKTHLGGGRVNTANTLNLTLTDRHAKIEEVAGSTDTW